MQQAPQNETVTFGPGLRSRCPPLGKAADLGVRAAIAVNTHVEMVKEIAAEAHAFFGHTVIGGLDLDVFLLLGWGGHRAGVEVSLVYKFVKVVV